MNNPVTQSVNDAVMDMNTPGMGTEAFCTTITATAMPENVMTIDLEAGLCPCNDALMDMNTHGMGTEAFVTTITTTAMPEMS